MRNEIRVIGIDDCSFDKFRDKGKNILVVGAVFRGGDFLDGLLSMKVRVDGINSTDKISEMINRSKFRSQIRAIMLDGIAVAGFNVIDIQKMRDNTGIPVIVVMRQFPNYEKIIKALDKIGKSSRIRIIEKAGKPERWRSIYYQRAGIEAKEAENILKITCTRSNIPEPIRAAHLIARGVATGESKGNA